MSALLVDIGNSRIKWRLVDVTASASADELPWIGPEHVLAVTEVARVGDAWASLAVEPVDSAFISNVSSPGREAAVIGAVHQTWGGVSIRSVRSSGEQSGVVNGYRDPAQLGTDRWMALVGAHALMPDRPLLVCSFGTATTIDLLVPDDDASAQRAVFVGGMIIPGLEAMRCALPSTTARLPLASGRVSDFADATDDAIASGIVAAQAGAVERGVRLARARSVARHSSPLTCLLAGGAAIAVAPFLEDTDFPVIRVHDLVLRGLAAVARARDR